VEIKKRVTGVVTLENNERRLGTYPFQLAGVIMRPIDFRPNRRKVRAPEATPARAFSEAAPVTRSRAEIMKTRGSHENDV
jgi:hypothetical protein